MQKQIDRNQLRGVWTALITPFRGGKIHWSTFKGQIERQIEGGVRGLVPTGTTGECPTLSPEEHIEVIRFCADMSDGRVPVIAGTGANSTAEAVLLTQAAEKIVGVSASLQVAPYYNRPNEDGLIAHFEAVAKSTGLPIILYNIPSRTGVDMTPKVVAALLDRCHNIIGIKEASGRPERASELRAAVGKEFVVLSGDDALTLPYMSLGATGVVSVFSNYWPHFTKTMVDLAELSQFQAALSMFEDIYGAIRLIFREGNPTGIKALMAVAGLDSGELRLPLVPASVLLQKEMSSWVRDHP